jgi:hypothetical protein
LPSPVVNELEDSKINYLPKPNYSFKENENLDGIVHYSAEYLNRSITYDVIILR